jgi:hypothetical protein
MRIKITALILVLLFLSGFLFWKPILVEALVFNDGLRTNYLQETNDIEVVELLVKRAKKINGEFGYSILSDSYLCLARNAEKKDSLELFDKSTFRVAFGGYTNMNWNGDYYMDEQKRYLRIFNEIE